MLLFGKWTTGVLLTWSAVVVAIARTSPPNPPKLIDVHEHFNGEPGVLQQMLAKLQAADGIGFLLVTQKGFPEASEFIHEHPDRFIGFGDIKLDDPNVLREIDQFHKAGFRGLGEI